MIAPCPTTHEPCASQGVKRSLEAIDVTSMAPRKRTCDAPAKATTTDRHPRAMSRLRPHANTVLAKKKAPWTNPTAVTGSKVRSRSGETCRASMSNAA